VGLEGQHTIWTIGTQAEGAAAMGRLSGRAQWTATLAEPKLQDSNGATDDPGYVAAIFAGGRGFVRAGHGNKVTLHHVDEDGTVTSGIDLPDFVPSDKVSVLVATSDVDDGVTARDRRTQATYVIAACGDGTVYVWVVHGAGTADREPEGYTPTARLMSRSPLVSHHTPRENGPTADPAFVLPVDPMGWHTSTVDWKNHTALQDVILTISQQGDLEFWMPTTETDPETSDQSPRLGRSWTRTGHVHSGKSNLVKARCSARKKTVLGEFPGAINAGI
jgi:hypothetical protein